MSISCIMVRRITFIMLFSFFFCMPGLAQPVTKQYPFRRLDISKGLSHNKVNSIFKDSKGFMWFGTTSGLNRYDGYHFKVFKHNPKDSTTINDDYIGRITEMPDSKLLIETRDWLNIYDPVTEKFSHTALEYLGSLGLPNALIVKSSKAKNGDFYCLSSQHGIFKIASSTNKAINITKERDSQFSYITSFSEDANGDFWLVRRNGVIEKLDIKTDKIIYSDSTLFKYLHGEILTYNVFADAQNELWIHAAGTTDEPHGVFKFNPATKELLPISKQEGKGRLNSNLVTGILQDNQSRIWICTDHGGINILDKKDYSVQYYVNNPDNIYSLSQNSITTAYKDNNGIVWVGTYKKGLNYYHENIIKFPIYRHQASNPYSLSYDDVNRFAEDNKGNLWIGTNGGGLIYFDRTNETFKQYRHQPANTNSLSNDVIVSLCIDSKQKLWIGTYLGGMDCYDGKIFTHYQHNPADTNSIADNRIWEIYEDKQNNLWVGTLGSGLDRFDRETNIFHHNRVKDGRSVKSDFISDIKEDNEQNLWIGTAYGLDVIDANTKQFTHYYVSSGLNSNNIISICTDASGRLWVGTREGLNLFNKTTHTFRHFSIEDGLPDNSVLNILDDNKGNLWISTPNGVSKITIVAGSKPNEVKINCKNYDESDGLQGTEFNENAALKTRKGELLFGGANGFNFFQPENIIAGKEIPGLVFTDFQLFNNSVAAGEKRDGKIILHQSITRSKSVTLNYNQNVIAIEFAAVDFSNTDKNKYAYTLEGFDKDWLVTDDKMRKAVYTNLDPGNYTFKVKSLKDDGSWNENTIELHIRILPPFWKSPLAYFLYVAIIVLILYIGRRRIIRKTREKFAIEQERQEALRMHELDLMKIKFFTNVSHEFRTPLSLILAPVENMLTQKTDTVFASQLKMVHRNARRLLNLVNQLLDFRKMEEKELKLHPRQGDIIGYISDVVHFFSDVADKKNISFSFNSNTDCLFTYFDHDKIERILFNLLSNAFKFTPENGHVGVEITSTEVNKSTGLFYLTINVQDTGIGIETDKQGKIFERFFQNDIPGSIVNQGSGIGLAITKEFIKLHGGSIRVESEPGKGSCFIISLSVIATENPFAVINNGSKEHSPQLITASTLSDTIEENEFEIAGQDCNGQPQQVKTAKQNNKKSSLLLVEDNEDFRFYLKDNLKEYFNIIEAGDGKQGWQKALAAHPDLIVSDISMPEMNGIDLCLKLKNDKRTTHIPVILLTAIAGEEQQLKGLETGANDYMTKPFNFEILLSKIKNQLAQQKQLKKTYQKQVEVKLSDVVIESADEKFMQQALALVEKNISEADFSVEDMSREMFISRVALYKKLLALSGKTPIEFIRQIRLKRSVQLLEKSKMTVAEVAYEVGFNNPKYFSKYFKAEYGKLPSVYMEEIRKSVNNAAAED